MTAIPDVLPVVAIAGDRPGPLPGHWTYPDYAALLDDGRRYEVVEGVLYSTPSPSEAHQAATTTIAAHLVLHVQLAGLGRVYAAPFDVELAPRDVVQPDVTVVLNARREIITDRGVVGAPDLVVEVLSPSTAGHDRRGKQDAYARAGVREYWLVDPATRTVELLQLEEGAYHSLGVYRAQALLPSTIVPGLAVRVEQFFA